MSSNPFDALAALVFGDEEIAASLASIGDPDEFAACASALAHARGIRIDAASLGVPGRDPLGIARWSAPRIVGDAPPPQWLPIHLGADAKGVVVDWAWFGPRPLSEPFFEDSIRRTLVSPFGRLFRCRTTLAALIAYAETQPCRPPDGFIFHMSRCGSTLAAQMLAALPRSIVVSEAAPIDAVAQLARGADEDAGARALRAMVASFGRPRAGDERRYVVKLDSWHALALPLFRRAFPDVPWVFLYRDPVEVLVSQMRQRGTQMLPQLFPPRFWGIENDVTLPDEDYCARVLAAICDAASDNAALGGGLMVDYRDLPRAVRSAIVPHFQLALGAEECAAMQAAARRDAKAPSQDFVADGLIKRREASDAVRRAVERHLDARYRRLVRLAAAQRISASMRIASPR